MIVFLDFYDKHMLITSFKLSLKPNNKLDTRDKSFHHLKLLNTLSNFTFSNIIGELININTMKTIQLVAVDVHLVNVLGKKDQGFV